MVNPVPGRTITTPYGKKGGWSGGRHGGADWAAPTGTPVVAAWSGTVTDRTWGSAYGTHIVVNQDRLPDGSPGLWGLYAHLSQSLVRPGQRVEAGQRIGLVGSTGNSTGPHLHYEVQRAAGWRSGNHVDPAPWIGAAGGAAPSPQPGEDDDMPITDSDAAKIANAVWSLQLSASNNQAAHTVLREARDLAKQARDLADTAPARTLNWTLDMGGGAKTAAWAVLKGVYENTVKLLK